MTSKYIILWALASVLATAERFHKESYLPTELRDGMTLVTVDAAFGGTLTMFVNAPKETFAWLYFDKNGKVTSRNGRLEPDVHDAITVIKNQISLMTREEKTRNGMDGYTVTFESNSGKTVLWTPSNPDVIKAIRKLCVVAIVPHIYKENGVDLEFYPGPRE